MLNALNCFTLRQPSRPILSREAAIFLYRVPELCINNRHTTMSQQHNTTTTQHNNELHMNIFNIYPGVLASCMIL